MKKCADEMTPVQPAHTEENNVQFLTTGRLLILWAILMGTGLCVEIGVVIYTFLK